MPVSGQDLFGGNIGRDLAACITLVNRLSPGYAQGSPFTQPDAGQAVDVVRAALETGHYDPRPRRLDVAGHAIKLAGELHHVFHAFQNGDPDAAACTVQQLLEQYDVRLRLSNHRQRPWHVHYRADIPNAADALGAGTAAALALVIDAGAHDRLRICAAERCDRALVDLSRNSSRRYCSFSCRNRTKTQALRRRAAERATV